MDPPPTVECNLDVKSKTLSIPFSENVIDDLKNFKISYRITQNSESIIIEGTNLIDFLWQSGDKNTIGTVIGEIVNDLKVWKLTDDAILPFKHRFSDVGYDLTIIKVHKHLDNGCIMFDTGIKIQVPCGYYVEIVPRSSLIKSGWILSNSVGIIDASYTGNLYIALTRIDSSAENIKLPFTGFQMLLRKQEYFKISVQSENEEIIQTDRGSGGFGSTNEA